MPRDIPSGPTLCTVIPQDYVEALRGDQVVRRGLVSGCEAVPWWSSRTSARRRTSGRGTS